MEPIINPWIFYVIDVVDALNFILPLLVFFSLFPAVLLGVCSMGVYDRDEWENCLSLKWVKNLVICGIVALLFSIIIPSKETMYKMLIAQQVTPNNIEYIHDTVLTDINSIVDKIVESKGEN